MQKKQLPQTLKKQQLTYHRWFMDMECRNDIIKQNQFINKKVRDRATPFSNRFKQTLKSNRMRLYYFVGFIVFFSMDRLYDVMVTDNKYIKYLEPSYILKQMLPKDSIREELSENQKQMRKIIRSNPNAKAIAQLFLEFDRNVEIGNQHIRDLKPFQQQGKINGDQNYVDMVRFVREFQHEDPSQLKDKFSHKFKLFY